ncbi:MAG TPA: aminotransferase class V-fold PLP-dependent enzyme [Chloroflexota bacterium]
MLTELDLTAIRADIPALASSRYFNTGGTGPSSRRALDAALDLERRLQEIGLDAPPGRELLSAVAPRLRAELAATLNVAPDEIALTRNVAEGINTVAWGMDWQPGDEVLLTDQEHPTGQLPWINLADRRGIALRRLALTPDVEALLGRLRAAIGPRTRLVAFSHVTCEDGQRLPAREIVALAHEAGVPVLFDAAQSLGQFPIDLRAIGCDYYAMTGHKWVGGGHGRGALYVRRDRIAELKPSWTGSSAPAAFDMWTGAYRLRDDAGRFEFGGRNFQMYASFAEALAQLREIGLDRVEAVVAANAGDLKRRLGAIDGCRILTPSDPARSAGIVTFELAGRPGTELVPLLWERGRVVCRHALAGRAVRLSVAYFTSPEEIAAVAELVAELAG